MYRYVCMKARPISRWCDDLDREIPDPPHLLVYEAEPDPIPTGLLDRNGHDICRMEFTLPVGFTARHEE